MNHHTDYRRFVILGQARSGSTFLRGLLNRHSQVVAFGELFRFPDSIGWDLPRYAHLQRDPELLRLSQVDPAAFLEQAVFQTMPKAARAVGFKLFYYHAREGARKAVWTYLKGQRDIRIIHLERRNLLAQILSEKRAFKTNRWANTSGEPEEDISIALDYEECFRKFSRAKAIRDSFDDFFSDHSILRLVYEDLARDRDLEMARVQEFLGVNHQTLKPATYKQITKPLSEVISNYAQLRERFQGTPWEPFFEHEGAA